MKKSIGIILFVALGLVGCATKQTNTVISTNQITGIVSTNTITTITENKAIATLRSITVMAEPLIAPTTQFACFTSLSYISDESEKQSVANKIYAISSSVSAVASGNLPDNDKITKIMEIYSLGKADLNKYNNVINAVNGIYQNFFNKITNSDTKLIIQVFKDMATGAAAGAKQAVPTVGQ